MFFWEATRRCSLVFADCLCSPAVQPAAMRVCVYSTRQYTTITKIRRENSIIRVHIHIFLSDEQYLPRIHQSVASNLNLAHQTTSLANRYQTTFDGRTLRSRPPSSRRRPDRGQLAIMSAARDGARARHGFLSSHSRSTKLASRRRASPSRAEPPTRRPPAAAAPARVSNRAHGQRRAGVSHGKAHPRHLGGIGRLSARQKETEATSTVQASRPWLARLLPLQGAAGESAGNGGGCVSSGGRNGGACQLADDVAPTARRIADSCCCCCYLITAAGGWLR